MDLYRVTNLNTLSTVLTWTYIEYQPKYNINCADMDLYRVTNLNALSTVLTWTYIE